ncbi:type II toxin-antitoxin system VapC family toxin [Dyadobacter sp. CY312]|uniref:type II toxin-antitoxin system VapC family toxin n=1 Tax=Dyadobacter sp. CY312 TaxID=2907303 RepID=UPI001F313BB9|nr:type II toxin-antitoxin system VapC family toxin [Dyadobacter sp. CY312]MCE7043583.1 type II toxin-antitoxin system VapC family toxin [Dyadobacter sp. CY312]
MEYFDSDVIFNFLVIQDPDKHEEARNLVFKAIGKGTFVTSTLTIQEVGYGLARFGLSNDEIESKLSFIASLDLAVVTQANIVRALDIAKMIGFKHINDCVHTALAESLSLTKFYTYNNSDFKRIQKHTNIEISIL